LGGVVITPTDTVRRFYDALGRGDIPAVLAPLDTQIEWIEAARVSSRNRSFIEDWI
jgi:ketosteroid isomerase-like protein